MEFLTVSAVKYNAVKAASNAECYAQRFPETNPRLENATRSYR